jgi:hypothetical protein
VGEPLSLEQFVRDRIHEDLLMARVNVAVSGAVPDRGTARSADRAQAVIDALDRWELLGLASTLERDGRTDLAADVRRALAAHYATHPDVRPEWLPAR